MQVEKHISILEGTLQRKKAKGYDTQALEERLQHMRDECAKGNHTWTEASGPLGGREYYACRYCDAETRTIKQ